MCWQVFRVKEVTVNEAGTKVLRRSFTPMYYYRGVNE